MQKNIYVIIVTLVFLYSCAQEDNNPNKNIANGGDIVINVEIASELKNDIRISQAQGKKPGLTNPVETIITVINESNTKKEILIKGNWYDSRGNNYGGVNQVIDLAPSQSETLTAGTRSKSVTTYKLSLTLNTKTQDELLFDTLSGKSQVIAEGYGMTYSETATDEIIPALPIRGFANGEAFLAKTISFNVGKPGVWRLQISDYAYDASKSLALARFNHKGIQTIIINLHQEPAIGDRLTQDMSYGGGYFQIKTAPTSTDTTSWNTSIAYVIEITDWNKEESADESCGFPDIGSASGKLYISFKGSEQGLKNSWISGEFKDVLIVYCAKK